MPEPHQEEPTFGSPDGNTSHLVDLVNVQLRILREQAWTFSRTQAMTVSSSPGPLRARLGSRRSFAPAKREDLIMMKLTDTQRDLLIKAAQADNGETERDRAPPTT